MITADEYRTAVKVLREVQPRSHLIPAFEQMADLREQWQRRVEGLGLALEDVIDPRAATAVNGMRAYSKLFELGWTPPEGLER